MTSTVVLVGGMVFLLNGQATAQVGGGGTPGTVPVWTADGTVLTDSHIQDNGTMVNVAVPLGVTGSGSGPAVFGSGGTGPGIGGSSSGDIGVVGSTSGTSGQAGVAGFGVQYGVVGFASATDVGWGVKGNANGNGVGVEGLSPTGVGVRGQSLQCDSSGCTPTAGDAGQFVAGGLTFRGFEAVAVEAVRELDANSKEALGRIADLERQNAELRRAIEVLAEAVKTLQQK
jgi:hypothetical protein